MTEYEARDLTKLICAFRNLGESGGPYVYERGEGQKEKQGNVSSRRQEERAHLDVVIVQRVGVDGLGSIGAYSCVGVLLDRVNGHGVGNRLDESRLLRSDEDAEAVTSAPSVSDRGNILDITTH